MHIDSSMGKWYSCFRFGLFDLDRMEPPAFPSISSVLCMWCVCTMYMTARYKIFFLKKGLLEM